MDQYTQLADELITSLNRKTHGPPMADVSATMRGEMAVLRLLAEEGTALTPGMLSKTLRMTTSRMAAVLGALHKKGLILRQTDAQDKRRVTITITDAGLALCQERRQFAVAHLSTLLSQLGKEDASHFVRIVKRMHALMPCPDVPICTSLNNEKNNKEEDCLER